MGDSPMRHIGSCISMTEVDVGGPAPPGSSSQAASKMAKAQLLRFRDASKEHGRQNEWRTGLTEVLNWSMEGGGTGVDAERIEIKKY